MKTSRQFSNHSFNNRHHEGNEPSSNPFNYLWFILIIVIGIFFAKSFEEVVVQKPDGSYEMHPERKRELDRRKEQIDEAEQYVLLATTDTWYPCYNCGDIFCHFRILNCSMVYTYLNFKNHNRHQHYSGYGIFKETVVPCSFIVSIDNVPPIF